MFSVQNSDNAYECVGIHSFNKIIQMEFNPNIVEEIEKLNATAVRLRYFVDFNSILLWNFGISVFTTEPTTKCCLVEQNHNFQQIITNDDGTIW